MLPRWYGGFIALEYARRWPQTVSNLVLVATSAGPVRAQARTFGSDAELREYFRGLWPLFFKRENKRRPLFDAVTFSAGAYNAAFTRELPAYDLREAVTAIDIPMLLVVGREDAYLSHMEWLAAHAKRATLCVFEDVGQAR